MRVLGCVALLVLALPLSAVSKSLSDVSMANDTPPHPPHLKKWEDSFKDFDGIKKLAVRSVGCSNIAHDCHCNYWKLLGLCDSQKYHVWMRKDCAASCGVCESDGGECQDRYPEKTCKMFTDHGFHRMSQFQYFMACACPVTSGICMTEVSTPAPTPTVTEAVEEDECLRLQNEKRSRHGAAALTWCPKCADFAKEFVELMQDLNGPLLHASPEQRTWLVDGESVLHGSNLQYKYPQVDCATAVESWYSEIDFYDPHRPVESLESAGHFTQMVWKDTTGVGCASTENYLACIYEPTGNTENAFDIVRNVQP